MKLFSVLLLYSIALLSCQTQDETRNAFTIRGFVGSAQDHLLSVDGFQVVLKSGDQVIATTTENPFEFTNLQEGLSYTVIPQTIIGDRNGVSTLDYVAIGEFLKGNKKFNAFQRIAADVNVNGSIDKTDPGYLQLCILGGSCPGWRFATADYNGFGAGRVDEFTISSLDSDVNIQFIPIKIGDVNGTIIP